MLSFILGRAGTGKTAALFEKMRTSLEGGAKVIYLVPEQYSFEAERQIFRRMGAQAALNAEVLSFTRLCDNVFRRFGGLAGVRLTDTARYPLMSLAVDEVRDTLRLYRKSAAKTAFLETLISACGELKTAGVSCGTLEKFAASRTEGEFKTKLQELGGVYSAYQSLIERGYSDPDDDLARAAMLLENNTFFIGMHVFVDGFTTFMAAEFELLGHIINQAEEICFAFTADTLLDRQRGLGVFSAAKSAMARLARLAENAGIETAEPKLLTEYRRFIKPELKHVAESFMEAAPGEYTGTYTGALELRPAADPYAELECVASEITRLVREEHYRYNEIGVVARDPGVFSREISSAFCRRGIPYFMSVAEDIENHPLAAVMLAALGAARGFETQQVLLFAKSPLLGLKTAEVALLENYCYCWDIRGALWHTDFTGNPKGLAGAMTESDLEQLGRINETRAAVAGPLLRLREALRLDDAEALARGVFDLLAEINAAENLTHFAESMENAPEQLAEAARLWDAIMDILDIFGAVLKDRDIPATRLCELFRLSLSAAKTASPPETLDQVIVGGADRIRPEKLRAVFVIGANENRFPAQTSGGGLFSELEREQLTQGGLELAPTSLQKAALEKYFAYFALTLASERLVVSWPRADLKSREMLPSVIVEQLRAMFPDLCPAGGACEEEAYYAALDADSLALMERAAARPGHSIERKTAQALFGQELRLSPSRVERYYKCPFSYFAADGLKLRRRGKVVFTGLEYGSAVHHVLQAMLARHGGAALAELEADKMAEEVREILREYLIEVTGGEEQIPQRLKFLFGRIGGTLTRLLQRLGQEFQQSGFSPYALELPIEIGGEVEPLRLVSSEGTAVTVEGKVDRIDIMEKNGKRYVRVVDYKSGAKSFALGDILYGLNLQMLLYLFTIAKNGRDRLDGAVPAGVLYMPARESWISAERGINAEAAAKEHGKGWRMSGLLLDDEDALRGMERELAGVYIPVKLGKDGKPDAASQIASAAEFARLARKVERLITAMAGELSTGKIGAVPARTGTGLNCAYCDYAAVCGFEEGDPCVAVRSHDRQEFFEIIEGEEIDDGRE